MPTTPSVAATAPRPVDESGIAPSSTPSRPAPASRIGMTFILPGISSRPSHQKTVARSVASGVTNAAMRRTPKTISTSDRPLANGSVGRMRAAVCDARYGGVGAGTIAVPPGPPIGGGAYAGGDGYAGPGAGG